MRSELRQEPQRVRTQGRAPCVWLSVSAWSAPWGGALRGRRHAWQDRPGGAGAAAGSAPEVGAGASRRDYVGLVLGDVELPAEVADR